MKDVARATSAAPTYFECKQVHSEAGNPFTLIDGGVFVNNPSLVAYSEARRIFPESSATNMKILSIGTGHSKEDYPYRKARRWGMAGWVKPIIDIMMSGAAHVAHYQIEKIYGTLGEKGEKQYLRVDADLDKYSSLEIDSNMDNASPKNMDQLKQFGKRLFVEKRDEIDRWLNQN